MKLVSTESCTVWAQFYAAAVSGLLSSHFAQAQKPDWVAREAAITADFMYGEYCRRTA